MVRCEHCQHRVTYQELDDIGEMNGDIFHICMLTDADITLDDGCEDYLRRPRQPWETVEEWEAIDND